LALGIEYITQQQNHQDDRANDGIFIKTSSHNILTSSEPQR
jgi:hypothetical protein